MKRLALLTLTLALCLALAGCAAELPAQPQRAPSGGVSHFNSIATTHDLWVGGKLNVTGSINGAENVDTMALESSTLETFSVTLGAQDMFTVAAGGIITPTGSVMQIKADDAVTVTEIAVGRPGDVLILVNMGTKVITVPDADPIKLTGSSTNFAMGMDDTLTLWSDGTNWIQIAASDN